MQRDREQSKLSIDKMRRSVPIGSPPMAPSSRRWGTYFITLLVSIVILLILSRLGFDGEDSTPSVSDHVDVLGHAQTRSDGKQPTTSQGKPVTSPDCLEQPPDPESDRLELLLSTYASLVPVESEPNSIDLKIFRHKRAILGSFAALEDKVLAQQYLLRAIESDPESFYTTRQLVSLVRDLLLRFWRDDTALVTLAEEHFIETHSDNSRFALAEALILGADELFVEDYESLAAANQIVFETTESPLLRRRLLTYVPMLGEDEIFEDMVESALISETRDPRTILDIVDSYKQLLRIDRADATPRNDPDSLLNAVVDRLVNIGVEYHLTKNELKYVLDFLYKLGRPEAFREISRRLGERKDTPPVIMQYVNEFVIKYPDKDSMDFKGDPLVPDEIRGALKSIAEEMLERDSGQQ